MINLWDRRYETVTMTRRRNHYAVTAGAAVGSGISGYKVIKDFYKPVRNNIVARINRNTQNVKMDVTPSHTMSGAPTTFQHDTKTTYKRRRAPRRIRKRARRAAKRFEKNLSTLLGCKRLVLNNYAQTVAPASLQTIQYIDFWNREDIVKAFSLFGTDVIPAGAQGFNPDTGIATELLFQRTRMEVEVKNSGTGLIYVDMYYWHPRKDTQFSVQTAIGQPNGATSDQAFATIDSSNVVTPSNTLAMSTMGVTPFDFPQFTENFIVYRTRRVMLQPNQNFSFDLKGRPGNQSSKDWLFMNYRRNISSGVILIASGEINTGGTGTVGPSISYHRQLWATLYKQGGKGAQSQTVVQTGI